MRQNGQSERLFAVRASIGEFMFVFFVFLFFFVFCFVFCFAARGNNYVKASNLILE